jgi:hypothetical protein
MLAGSAFIAKRPTAQNGAARSVQPDLLQIVARQPGVLCDSGEDARAQFLIVMEGKNEVWMFGPGERAV